MRKGFRIDQCSAIITGASSGLGAEFARQLAPRARALVLTARRQDALETVKAEVERINPSLSVFLCPSDIATDEGRNRLIEVLDASDARPDVLINNAGMGDYGTLATADPARLHAQIDLNITALVLLCRTVVGRLSRAPDRPAAILNIGSLAGVMPMPDSAVYAATKSFVASFSEALRVEVAPDGIIVSCVCPGPTPTNFGHHARRPDGEDTDRSGQDLIRIPPARVVRRALVALERNEACVFPGTGASLAAILFRLMPRPILRRAIAKRFQRSRA